MIEGIENLNVKNTALVVEKLAEITNGRAVANLMTRRCLAKTKTNTAPTEAPAPAEANADDCVWCLEGVIAAAVEPDALKWQKQTDGDTVMKYDDRGHHLLGEDWDVAADFLPEGWWTHHFGVQPAALTPPQTFEEPFWTSIQKWRPKERADQLGNDDVRLWELNDCIGPVAWEWTAEHFSRLRDHWLPGGKECQP